MTTHHLVDIPTPDGGEASVAIAVDWQHETNPCDKEAPPYNGEDDGWQPVKVELV